MAHALAKKGDTSPEVKAWAREALERVRRDPQEKAPTPGAREHDEMTALIINRTVTTILLATLLDAEGLPRSSP